MVEAMSITGFDIVGEVAVLLRSVRLGWRVELRNNALA